MTPGLLSVILPNYNHSAYVAGQIGAVLGQSYRNIELIVIDDASTDNSIAVIEAAIAGDSRARLIKYEKNLGVMEQIVKGRALAQGEFLHYAAADDFVLPGFFEKSMSMLLQHPQAGVSFAVMAWIDPTGTKAQPMPLRIIPQAAYLTPEEFCEVICGEHITGHTSIFRVAALETMDFQCDDFKHVRWLIDWFMGSVVACRTGVCHIPEPLVAIRLMGTNYGQGMYNWNTHKEVVYAVLRLLKSPPYRDVISYFARGGLFSNQPFIARAVLANPEFWDVESMMITQKSMFDWAMERRQKQQEHWQPPQPQRPQGFSR